MAAVMLQMYAQHNAMRMYCVCFLFKIRTSLLTLHAKNIFSDPWSLQKTSKMFPNTNLVKQCSCWAWIVVRTPSRNFWALWHLLDIQWDSVARHVDSHEHIGQYGMLLLEFIMIVLVISSFQDYRLYLLIYNFQWGLYSPIYEAHICGWHISEFKASVQIALPERLYSLYSKTMQDEATYV